LFPFPHGGGWAGARSGSSSSSHHHLEEKKGVVGGLRGQESTSIKMAALCEKSLNRMMMRTPPILLIQCIKHWIVYLEQTFE
jgi:hypothetical protein